MVLLEVLLPLVLVLGLGYGLGRGGFYGRAFILGLNRLAYYVGLPALIVHSLAGATWSPEAPLLVGVFLGATLLAGGAAVVAARFMGLPGSVSGAFVQAGLRGNLAYVALPVLVSLYQHTGHLDRALVLALVALGPAMLLYNIIGVLLLTRRDGGGAAGRVVRLVVTNPLILASLAGLLLAVLGCRIPGPLRRTLEILGDLSVPAALLCVGGVMALVRFQGGWMVPAAAALVKCALLPLTGWAAALALGLDPVARTVLLVLCSAPTAVASYIMALELGGDEGLASQAVVFSTLFSAVPLALVLMAG